MTWLLVISTFASVFTIPLVHSESRHTITINKRLNNAIELAESEWSTVKVTCSDFQPKISVITPHVGAEIFIYFANEAKNILAVDLTGREVIGHKYESPHRKAQVVKGATNVSASGGTVHSVPWSWFPENVTRLSASIRKYDEIYNYYGLFNYPLSIPDVMVVEEYQKIIKFCS